MYSAKNVRPKEEWPRDLALLATVSVAFVNTFRQFLYLSHYCNTFTPAVTLSCGESSPQNCTYLEQASTSTLASQDCTYRVCPINSDICRIRYDFTVSLFIQRPFQQILILGSRFSLETYLYFVLELSASWSCDRSSSGRWYAGPCGSNNYYRWNTWTLLRRFFHDCLAWGCGLSDHMRNQYGLS